MIITNQEMLDKLAEMFNLESLKAQHEMSNSEDDQMTEKESGKIESFLGMNSDDTIEDDEYLISGHPDYIYNEHIIELIDQTLTRTFVRSLKDGTKIYQLDPESAHIFKVLHQIKMDLLHYERAIDGN